MLEKFCCYIYYTYICIDFYWFRYHIFLKRNRTRLIRPVSTSFFSWLIHNKTLYHCVIIVKNIAECTAIFISRLRNSKLKIISN